MSRLQQVSRETDLKRLKNFPKDRRLGMWYGAWFFADSLYCPHGCECGDVDPMRETTRTSLLIGFLAAPFFGAP
jgi:hypothetical protein